MCITCSPAGMRFNKYSASSLLSLPFGPVIVDDDGGGGGGGGVSIGEVEAMLVVLFGCINANCCIDCGDWIRYGSVVVVVVETMVWPSSLFTGRQKISCKL